MSTGKADPAVAAGAEGHLFFTEANEEELALRMFSLERGDAPGASRMARHILGVIAASAKPRPLALAVPKGRLSPRELQVLRLISQGWSNRKIAGALHRSASTIDTQIKSIYRKLAVNSRTQAVREATRQGLLSWDAGTGSAQ
jgi:DNA-binding NarL/FixJ family response regulator